ncbi:hypothetical protein OSB04_007825 [Centaurea solstitialis]|uniref:Uncharacterized protein n=1 Tax=Centaurea solstitialis TaxID=347529 RepID=A0AA38TKL3_9ASTR|nr:hypothetical protein OSB04_007825 [Centaurea solstitialis]
MIREDEGFANYPFDESWVTTDDIEVDISEEERAQNVNEDFAGILRTKLPETLQNPSGGGAIDKPPNHHNNKASITQVFQHSKFSWPPAIHVSGSRKKKSRKMLESRLIAIVRRGKSINQIRSSFSSSHGGGSTNVYSRFGFNHCYSTTYKHVVNPVARRCLFDGFRSVHNLNKGSYKPSFKYMSTVAATACKENKETVKLLVTAGPHAQKAIGIWLFASAAWVFSMVILGGVTRLTRSGLSMTDWKFTGSLPPLTDEDWLVEFEKYKQSPEFKRLAGLFALGGGQGMIGWWMVKSGLEEPPSEYSQPRVSPYRLAAHLTSAFAIYCGLFWTALSVVMPEPPTESVAWVNSAARVKRFAIPVGIIVGITAVSGAFVAGNDAGHAFNTFPKMGDSWIPEDVLSMKPLIRNFFENTATVQLDHRILATATLASIGGLWWSARKLDLHPAIRSLIGSTMGMAALQVFFYIILFSIGILFTDFRASTTIVATELIRYSAGFGVFMGNDVYHLNAGYVGISTLLSYVPVSLGTAHQAGALTLLTLMLLLNHTLRRPSPMLLKSLPAVAKTI